MFSLVVLATLAALTSTTSAQWIDGRATYYPGPGEAATDMSTLSCTQSIRGFTPRSNSWFGAMADKAPLYAGPACQPNPNGGPYPICPNQGSCGKCYEIKCVSKFPAENGGAQTCIPGKSVTVQIVDACPHNHPVNLGKKNDNPCQDTGVNHIDLNINAFKEIANLGAGTIRTQIREVACTGLGPNAV
ncbi:RlpA-like double-psi beta-barrel-protein domain-containing protein-containing protein [Paraphysoderma sedebokerense]|nr:RlpA-like double-psi beta-barrel-protein domain-containing protein-containing protein [Paraphysoderma sedebokerense]